MNVNLSDLDSHLNETFIIREKGLKLTPDHQRKIRQKLKSLELRAPAICSIRLDFIAKQKRIDGELSIIGAGKVFRAKVQGEDPWSIYQLLEKDIDKQLKRWKKNRFLNHSSTIPTNPLQGPYRGGLVI